MFSRKMFSRPDFPSTISDVRALLGAAEVTTISLDNGARSRLATIRQAIIAEERTAGQRRVWWPARPWRRHRRLIVGSLAVPASLAAMAAGWAIATAPPASRVTLAVICYSLPHLPQQGISESAAGGIGGALTPTAMCASQWQAGDVVAGVHQAPASLVACSNPGLGEVAVFPDTTCAAAGLPPLAAGYERAARRFDAFSDALMRGLIGGGREPRCVSEAAAVSFTRKTARTHGFGSWPIISPRHAGGPACWQAAPDPATHTIQIAVQPGVLPPASTRSPGPSM